MTPSTASSIDFVTFSLILDDIVFPDGQTAMGMLGGGGPQTAFGMRLWAEKVGIVGGVGPDWPASAQEWLAAAGVDTQGVRHSTEWRTPRAWQVLEADGRRTQVWRVSGPGLGRQLGRSLARVPPAYRRARGFHLGVHPEEPDLAFIRALRRETGAVISIEPFRPAQRPLSDDELGELLAAGQIFSPNRAEAESLVGPGDPEALLARLLEAGAEMVALRQGAAGALLRRAGQQTVWHIPALPLEVIDPTGAGNAFCGGFLVGWVQTGQMATAGLYGTVAASFLVEQVGLPPPANWRVEARRRLETLRPAVSRRSTG